MNFMNQARRYRALLLLLAPCAGCSGATTTDKEATDTRAKYENKAAAPGTTRNATDRTAGDPNVTGPPR